MTFDNTNPADGTEGAITGGLAEVRAAGVKEVTKGAEGTAPQEQAGPGVTNNAEQANNSGTGSTGDWWDLIERGGSDGFGDNAPDLKG